MNLYYLKLTLNHIEFKGEELKNIPATAYIVNRKEDRNPTDFFPDWDNYSDWERQVGQGFLNELLSFEEALNSIAYFNNDTVVDEMKMQRVAFPWHKAPDFPITAIASDSLSYKIQKDIEGVGGLEIFIDACKAWDTKFNNPIH
jgi:Na+-transporting NADH:ubiquinone oxidoreductase subunit NqrF